MMPNTDKPKLEKLKKALEKHGIFNEEQLHEAVKNMKPLNIGCMISPVPTRKEEENQSDKSSDA